MLLEVALEVDAATQHYDEVQDDDERSEKDSEMSRSPTAGIHPATMLLMFIYSRSASLVLQH